MNKENDSIQMIDSNSSNNDNNSNKRVKLDHHDDSNSNSNDNSLFIDMPLIAPSIATIATETKVIEYCHANDIISLVYLNANTTNANNDFKLHEPTYTHQLFENEDIAMLTKEEATGIRILIIIRGCDLSHRIILIGKDLMTDRDITKDITTTDGVMKENKKLFKYIIECLQAAIPADTDVYHTDIDWNDNINIKELLALRLRKYDDHNSCSNDNSLDTLTWGTSSIESIPGSVLASFPSPNANEGYELRLATNADEGASALLKKAEGLAMWYIETADGVDFSDSRWEVVNLYKTTSTDSTIYYSLIGYMTLFTFRNPFAGAKIRVCQALVLPIYQGQGWGKKMMLQVYKRTKDRADTTEVTVEDPAPGFQCMRDAVDIEWALQHKDSIYNTTTTTTEFLEVSDVASTLKITSIQAQFVLNALQFHDVYPNTTDDEAITIYESESSYRTFRLAVKRGYLKYDKDLKSLPKDVMQKELDTLYTADVIRFKRVRPLIARFTYFNT